MVWTNVKIVDLPIEVEIRRTGNKKALHQKGKNKIKTWRE